MSIYTAVKKCVLCFNKLSCISDIFGGYWFLPDNRHMHLMLLSLKNSQQKVSTFKEPRFMFQSLYRMHFYYKSSCREAPLAAFCTLNFALILNLKWWE